MKCLHLPLLLLTCLLAGGRGQAGVQSLLLPSSQWVTPVRLISVTTAHGPGVTLEYGPPCLAAAGNRLRKLVHNFGKKGFILVQYRTPYAGPAGHCPDGTLFFLPENQWRNVDFEVGTVRLDIGSTKNKDGRVIMTAQLRALLEEQRQKTLALQRQTEQIIPLVFHDHGWRIANYYKR